MKKNVKYGFAAGWGILFVLWILLIRTVDVAPIGPNGTNVGFSTINGGIYAAFGGGLNEGWYKLTEVFGILALCVCALFGLYGALQLIKGKSIKSVDKTILALGGLYVVTIILYVLFDKIPINYRPMIMPGETELETSFPSSHTMLICVVMGSLIITAGHFFKNKAIATIVRILSGIVLVATVIGRLISGAHWFTDIVGGILISAALVILFSAIVDDYC